MKNPRPSQKIGRLPVAPSIPSQHVVIVANNSDKFGFGVGAVRFPHYEASRLAIHCSCFGVLPKKQAQALTGDKSRNVVELLF